MTVQLDPQAAAYLEATARLGLPSLREQGPVEARLARSRRTPELAGPPIPLARVEDLTMPGPGGPLRLRLYAPAAHHPLPVLVYFHGGGWVTGDLDTHDQVCRGMAEAAACMIIAVDFRSAPENPFPAALDDCWEATRWVADRAAALGGDPARLAVGGDSAGGNLASVVARRARDLGGPTLSAQVLFYPVTDHSFETDSYHSNATGYGLTADSMRWYWEQYLGPGGDPASEDVAPLRAGSLGGLPPAFVVTCGFDPLRDEGIAYVRRLQEAGVRVEHVHEADMIHGYLAMPAVISRAVRTWHDCGGFLKAQLA